MVAVNRIINNVRARKYGAYVPWIFYVFPVLLMAVSGFVMSKPLEIAGIPFYILGISMIVYGIIELFNTIWLHNMIQKLKNEAENQIVPIDVVYAKKADDVEKVYKKIQEKKPFTVKGYQYTITSSYEKDGENYEETEETEETKNTVGEPDVLETVEETKGSDVEGEQ